jgi:alpha-mannosidase
MEMNTATLPFPATQRVTERTKLPVVASFHYDVAYLKTYSDYLPDCFLILDEALRILDAEPDYRFVVEQVILLQEYWAARPGRRADLVRLAYEGRLEIAPGMYVMPDLNHPSGEALFRQVEVGFRWLEEHLGIRPKVCYIADCWGHPAQLPQILRQCGYSYYVFWRCMREDVAITSFQWQGLDGTRLPTHWLPFGYGTLRFPAERDAVNALDLRLVPGSPEAIRALVAKMSPYSDEEAPLLFNGGDMAFPQASGPDRLRPQPRNPAPPRRRTLGKPRQMP